MSRRRALRIGRCRLVPAEEHPGGGADAGGTAEPRRHHEDDDHPSVALCRRRLLDHPLAEEGAERRQAEQADGGEHEQDADHRLDPASPGQLVDVDGAPAVEEHAGTHEQRTLEEGVAEHEQRRAGQGPGIEHREPDQEQACVGDGGEGEEPLEVDLHQAP